MLTMGLDFGSTYTTISVYRQETGMVEAITLASSPYIPSIVTRTGERYDFGVAAKKKTGFRNTVTYKGFKMLLPETEEGLLRARGYNEKYAPRYISRRFLDSCLRKALDICHGERIERLVVGAPEIWNERMGTEDPKTILKDLFRDMEFVKNVQVVSEPAAATAFFAHNFKLMTGQNYDGTILLIDYGGGTLDLTLTSVSAGESGAVEIKVLERTGAGENAEGRIGQAGIVYMESVTEEAIRRAGLAEEDAVIRDGRFYRTVDQLEDMLQTCTEDLKYNFDKYGIDDPEDLEEEIFTDIEYDGEEVPVSYGLLLEVYDRVIRGILNEKLDLMIGYMKKHAIPYMDRNQDVFKIALVGGFGNFYLVNHQVEEKFKFSGTDRRQKYIIRHEADREKSISMGAAMLAAGVTAIRNTAPFSIGLCTWEEGTLRQEYAITGKQDLEYGKAYYGSDPPVPYLITGRKLTRFLVSKSRGDQAAFIAPVRAPFAEKIRGLFDRDLMAAAVGFSLDPAGVVSIHVREYDLRTGAYSDTERVAELAGFEELFDMSKLERVVDQ